MRRRLFIGEGIVRREGGGSSIGDDVRRVYLCLDFNQVITQPMTQPISTRFGKDARTLIRDLATVTDRTVIEPGDGSNKVLADWLG